MVKAKSKHIMDKPSIKEKEAKLSTWHSEVAVES